MDKDVLKQFQNIIGKFASAKIMTKDDIDQILKGVLTIMNSFKKGNQTLNTSTQKSVEDLLKKVETIKDELETKTSESLNKTTEELNTQTKKQLAEMRSLFNEFLLLRPEDGQPGADADDQYIIEELAKLIPESEKIELDTAEEIVVKLQSLKGEERLSAKYIKDLPKFFERIIQENGAHGGAYETPIVDATGRPLSKNAQGAFIIPNQNSGGGGFTYINEIVAGSGTSFTLAHVPVDSSRVALYGGGSRLTPTADYTISGAAITMAFGYSAGQVLADYS